MHWDIKPFTSVGPVTFGMSRDEVHRVLGQRFGTFYKVPGDNETDDYTTIGAHLCYTDYDTLEAVELFDPATATYDAVQFLGTPMQVVSMSMQERGRVFTGDDCQTECPAIGIALTLSMEGTVEGVLVYAKGYRDASR